MTTFAKFFTREQFDAFAAFCAATPYPEQGSDNQATAAWYDTMHDERDRAIIKPAMEFFKAKLAAGELKVVPNSAGRSLNLVMFWDALVTDKGEAHIKRWALEEIEQIFSSMITSSAAGLFDLIYGTKDKIGGHDKIYATVVDFFDKGNFPWFLVNQHQSCGTTGEYLNIDFQDWTPIIGNGTRAGFTACKPLEPATAPQSLQIEFKTGDLVAMDWFRGLDGLSDWFEAKGSEELPSINSGFGVMETTKFYADLGVVHVFVGNSSPNVYTGEGLITCGSNWREYTADGRERYSDADDDGNPSEEAEAEYEDATENAPAGMEDHGIVCTDLWWVTMMERSRLIEIFVEQLGEEHRAEIEAYAAEEFDVNLKVQPGKYTLHYDGHPSSFYALLDDKTKFGIGTPYFALTKDLHENTDQQPTI